MSRLEDNSADFRDKLLTKNIYKKEDEYHVSHANALSDGDAKGKGETDTIGSNVDIKSRETLITKNKYNSNNEYSDSNA